MFGLLASVLCGCAMGIDEYGEFPSKKPKSLSDGGSDALTVDETKPTDEDSGTPKADSGTIDEDTGSIEDTGEDPDLGITPPVDTGTTSSGPPCIYCVGTCATFTADSACYVTCASKGYKCKFDKTSATPCVCF